MAVAINPGDREILTSLNQKDSRFPK